MIAILTVLLLGAVILVVSAPLRTGRSKSRGPTIGHRSPSSRSGRIDLADLHAAREAKYREIRDAELDFRTGKLSEKDFAAVDRSLRAEAVELLDRMDALDDDDSPDK